jgi:hypothetical protein
MRHATVFVVLCSLLLCRPGFAQEPRSAELQRLQGAWVPEGSKCAKVFFRQGTSIRFHQPGALVRKGILIEGNRVSDARLRCTITRLKPTGDTYTMLVRCLRHRSLISSTVSFSLRFLDEDTVIKTFSDFPEEKLKFRRCKV